MHANIPETDKHIILAIWQGNLLHFLEKIREYLGWEDKIRESLKETPIEDFSTLVDPIISKKWKSEGLSDRELQRQEQEKRLYTHLKKIIDEVVQERKICTWCYKGEESIRGGRNGGEEYSTCSNSTCISHTFMR